MTRGYLIPRLERLLGSVWLSLLISSLIFASAHRPPNGFLFVRHTVAGLIYGGVFCLTRRLWPIVVSHAVYNLWLDLR